jgi:hypothetical protein
MPHYCEICDADTDNTPGLILVDMGEGTAICQDCLAAHATVCHDEEETTMADTWYAHVFKTAQHNLQEGASARQAAREALQEAHSALSQAAFFAALDACGGQPGVLDRLAQDLAMKQETA